MSCKFYKPIHKGQKKLKVGYQAFVWLEKAWSLVDGFFGTALEASQFVERRYAPGTRCRTRALRFDCVPISVFEGKGELK